MAGSFGFEAGKYDVSLRLRRARAAAGGARRAPTTWSLADGYSCREQIAQCTGRTALHLAQVLRMALEQPEGA